MGFFDNIREGRLSFFGKREPDMVVELMFRGQTHLVEELNVEFQEGYGALITLTLNELPDSLLEDWMFHSNQKQTGELRFYPNDNLLNEGCLTQITFREAYCVRYQQVMQPQGSGLLTTLVISPRRLRIGNEEFENRWS
ncbi:MAG: hypothetical protein LBN93_09540 [Candidatus Symbiothrix sp.]|jgi:hypothetical protein|nr:hypothetical protein [Candidatus Symbiothrix sp.]